MEPKSNEQAQQQPQPKNKPRVRLDELDARFVADMDNKSLSGTSRTWAGRLHQLVLHVQMLSVQVVALGKARQSDLQEVKQGFDQIVKEVTKLVGIDEPDQQEGKVAESRSEEGPGASAEPSATMGAAPIVAEASKNPPPGSGPVSSATLPRPPRRQR